MNWKSVGYDRDHSEAIYEGNWKWEEHTICVLRPAWNRRIMKKQLKYSYRSSKHALVVLRLGQRLSCVLLLFDDCDFILNSALSHVLFEELIQYGSGCIERRSVFFGIRRVRRHISSIAKAFVFWLPSSPPTLSLLNKEKSFSLVE